MASARLAVDGTHAFDEADHAHRPDGTAGLRLIGRRPSRRMILTDFDLTLLSRRWQRAAQRARAPGCLLRARRSTIERDIRAAGRRGRWLGRLFIPAREWRGGELLPRHTPISF